jgi:SAM-dependent methyltransferase
VGEKTMDWAELGEAAAREYAEWMVPAMFVPFEALMVQAAGVREGAAVLDVACGTGAIARAAARAAGRDGRVTGVDLADHMLNAARGTPAEAGAAPITYLQGSAEALPVEDAAYDAVTCHHGLQFVDDRPGAVREMRRALRSGGHVAIAVWGAVGLQPHFAALADALERHVGEEAATLIRSSYALDDHDLLTDLLTGAGFTDVTITRETRPTTYASHEDFARRTVAAGPVAARFEHAPANQQQAVADDVTEALRGLRTDDGRLASEMTTVIATGRVPA